MIATAPRQSLVSMVAWIAMAGVLCAGPAEAVQRMYAGQLRFGHGDADFGLDTAPGATMGKLEQLERENNALPPCAAPGAVVTPSGMGSVPPVTPNGAGPQTGTIDFHGLANVVTTGMGRLDVDAPITFSSVMATPAGLHKWGLTTDCPTYFTGVPSFGLYFRSTQMVRFSWPTAPGTMAPGRGAIPLLTPGGGISQTAISAVPESFSGRALQRIGVVAGPNRYGGSIAIIGNADTRIGVNSIPGFGLPLAIGTLPFPIYAGANGGLGSTTMGAPATIPTGSVSRANAPLLNVVTNYSEQHVPGGPIPPTTAPGYPLPPFGTFVGFAWTTGIVTAFDSIGFFRTTRTRTGAALDVTGPFTGSITATLQTVSPSVLIRGLTGLFESGVAMTAELEIRFVPEPIVSAMFAAGVGALGWMAVRRRRRCRGTSTP